MKNKPILASVVVLCSLLMAGDPVPLQLSPAEKEMLELTNAERKKKDLPILKPNPLLFKAARGHSANMAKQGKMEHELDGKNPLDRVRDTGYKFAWSGENIAYGDDDITAKTIMEGWMDSPPHRKNILNERYSDIGLGIVRDSKGRIYYTQVFGQPR